MNQVPSYWRIISVLLFGLIIGWGISQCTQQKQLVSTNSNSTESSYQKTRGNSSDNPTESYDKKSRENSQNNSNNNQNNNYSNTEQVPAAAREVLIYVLANHKAMDGYVGGRVFENREDQLPVNDVSGNKIDYQEWDIYPKVKGKNRGTYRMVTGSDGRNWYTSDHYRTFTLIQ